MPANRLTNFGGGRYDLDACTLRLQSARFSRKENSLLKITTKLVSDFEKSIQRPIILPRGAKLPDREDIPVKSNQFKEDSPLSLKIGISQAIIYLVQYCCIHLGDLVRYQRQQNVATSFYITACHIDPTCGHAYNQMGLIEASKVCPVSVIAFNFHISLHCELFSLIDDLTVCALSTCALSAVLFLSCLRRII